MSISIVNSLKCKLSKKTLWSVVWHPKYNKLYCAGSEKKIFLLIFDDNLKIIEKISRDTEHSASIRSLSLSACGDFLAAASFDTTISIFYIDEKNIFTLISVLEGHTKEVKSVSWHHNNNFLASCGRDCSVWVWEFIPPNEFMCASVAGHHLEDVKKVNFSPKNNLLVSCGFDSQLIFYDMDEENEWIMTDSFKQQDCIVWSCSFSPDAKYLVVCTSTLMILIYDIDKVKKYEDLVDPDRRSASNALIYEFKSPQKLEIFDISWSPDGSFISTCSLDNSIYLFKVNYSPSFSLEESLIINDIDCETNSIAWRNDEKLTLACVGDDGYLNLFKF